MSSGQTSSSSSSSAAAPSSWRPGADLLDIDPSALASSSSSGEGSLLLPRLAKDEDYAKAILTAWRAEIESRPTTGGGDGDYNRGEGSVASPLAYRSKNDGSRLYGHVYRSSPPPPSDENDSSSEESSLLLPGVVLFHTGAGPQDAFLRWKADSLATDREMFGEGGCVVLIADIIGDATGWAWSDRERYDAVRGSVLVPDGNRERRELAGRVRAAIDALKAQPGVDPDRIGAMGFCLGGHPILELARMRDPSVRVMATFHGVFDGVRDLGPPVGGRRPGEANAPESRVLVCTGEDDPFIPTEDLDAAMKMFEDSGCQTELMRFEGTRHGFTNPAQDCNPNPAFAYHGRSCAEAWSAALTLLKSMAS